MDQKVPGEWNGDLADDFVTAAEGGGMKSTEKTAEAAGDQPDLTAVLAAVGVFQGHQGLVELLNADEFWKNQPYGTRLYYGHGITEYLHRDVLRAAVNLLADTTEHTPPQAESVTMAELLCCDVCGGRMIYIRGRHPGTDNRIVCPTCMAETLDDIKGRLRADYGRDYQAT